MVVDARLADQPSPALPALLVHRRADAGRGGASRRRPRLPALALLAATGAIAAGAWFAVGRQPSPTQLEPPSIAARLPEGPVATRTSPGTVVGLGRLLPRSRIVTVAVPFGAGDARVASLLAIEGQRVEAGAILAILDSEPNLRAALAAAEAEVASREALLVQARVIAASAREEARAALARAEAAITANRRDLDRAVALLDRAVALLGRGASTEQVVDQRRVAYQQAVQDAARARATLLRYDADDPERQADVLVARRALDAARAEAERARADLGKAGVRAPFDGTVLTILARLGERPGEAGLMTFGALDDMIAEVEVYETYLRDLSPGVPVSLAAAALPTPLRGRVSRIGAEILRQTLTDASPAANTDTRVARVTVDLDPASSDVARRVPNLQVTAWFGTEARR